MPLRWHRLKHWLAGAGLVFCALMPAAHAQPDIDDAGSFLDQTERVRTTDHPRFVRMLGEIHAAPLTLTQGQQWHLRYLDAWETAFEGDYAKAQGMLRDIIDRSGNDALTAKASALLMNNLALGGHVEEALELANRLTQQLPATTDRLARFVVLANLAQIHVYTGQQELAIKYAHMMEDTLPSGETLCNPLSMQASAMEKVHRLRSWSVELQSAIDICTTAGQPVFANTMWLLRGNLYLQEGKAKETVAMLQRIMPSIKANRYFAHKVAAQAELAQAYWQMGDDANASRAALQAVSLSNPDDFSEALKDAYEVLYRVEKKHGNASAALPYYERYVAQDKDYLDAIRSRTLALSLAEQHMRVQKLETDALSKQNNILRLQQALDIKAVETSRLYITLLLLALVLIALILLRIKRSQLRFKRLSHHDGLTGIFNHQHFIAEADRALHLLEKRQGSACLIFIDLDHFKNINDNHGHAMGDSALRHTVSVCQRQLRPTDLFGRLGGEEFGVLLQDCSREEGMAIADRIRIAIEATPLVESGKLVSLSASVGLASSEASGYRLQRLCREADAALYRAKRTGRNRVIADTENGGLVEA